jgi:three-Cys-motif partner protein
LEKLRRHNYVTAMFARSMKNKWPQRAYVGLYCGAGRARLAGTGEILETTAMSVMRLPDGFTHHIFVDEDPRCTDALKQRAAALPGTRQLTILTGDVSASVPAVQAALPSYSNANRLLTFCFVDPFGAELKFSTISSLAQRHQMDFLILLALGVDIRRNLRRYLSADSGTRIGELINLPGWQSELDAAGGKVVPFVLGKFDDAMVRLGYLSSKQAHPVKVSGMGVLLYYLAYYSKHPLGLKFWNSTLAGLDPQEELGLER